MGLFNRTKNRNIQPDHASDKDDEIIYNALILESEAIAKMLMEKYPTVKYENIILEVYNFDFALFVLGQKDYEYAVDKNNPRIMGQYYVNQSTAFSKVYELQEKCDYSGEYGPLAFISYLRNPKLAPIILWLRLSFLKETGICANIEYVVGSDENPEKTNLSVKSGVPRDDDIKTDVEDIVRFMKNTRFEYYSIQAGIPELRNKIMKLDMTGKQSQSVGAPLVRNTN